MTCHNPRGESVAQQFPTEGGTEGAAPAEAMLARPSPPVMCRITAAPYLVATAVFSPDRVYRYVLHRRWAHGAICLFLMLNPSTGSAGDDDATIRRCVGFAHAQGCGALTIVNLFGLVATDPRQLRRAVDPVGPDNDTHVAQQLDAAYHRGDPCIAAWGTHAPPERVEAVLGMPHARSSLTALATTNGGAPPAPVAAASQRRTSAVAGADPRPPRGMTAG